MNAALRLLNKVLGTDVQQMLHLLTRSDTVESFPAEEFEKAHGLTGVSRTYILPDALKPHMPSTGKFEHRALTLPQTNEINDQLIQLNPELQNIDRRRESQFAETTLLHGAISRFNPADIEAHIRLIDLDVYDRQAYNQETDKRNRDVAVSIEPVTGRRWVAEWGMSEETASLVRQQVKDQPADGKIQSNRTVAKRTPSANQ